MGAYGGGCVSQRCLKTCSRVPSRILLLFIRSAWNLIHHLGIDDRRAVQSFVANSQVVADIYRAPNSAKMRKIANKFGLSLMPFQKRSEAEYTQSQEDSRVSSFSPLF